MGGVLCCNSVYSLHAGVEVKGQPGVSHSQLSGVDITSNLFIREAKLFSL